MSRIVNVSNRVALPKGGNPTGGLAVGVLAAMQASGGLWFGWSGETVPDEASIGDPEIVERDGIGFATIALPAVLHEPCYNGFANGTLWPLFHSFLDAFRYQDAEYEAYLAVNTLFATRLKPLLRAGDLVWVHDYHLIPLAARLREEGVHSPLGFFLHIPFPNYEVLRALPHCEALLRGLLAYDVVGFQTETDRHAFLGAVEAVWGKECIAGDGAVELVDRTVRTGVFPIGVDVGAVARSAARAERAGRVRHMKEGLLGRRLIIGVDRLDYSKGLLERFEAFRHFLAECPEHHGRVTYLQIAPLGRQDIKAYGR
ncbi:MAG: trehalose-6-phosphate synthase, partial [Gammaproteobacteria bacterium]